MSEYAGRVWVCSCGWKGDLEEAYEHAGYECPEDWPQVGPLYKDDRYSAGEQATLIDKRRTRGGR